MVGGMNRRQFLRQSAAVLGSAACPSLRAASAPQPPPLACFFLVSDTHFLAEKLQPDLLNETSRLYTSRLVQKLNCLPGTAIPDEAGGGTVGAVQGVIHTGDVVDSGDKRGPSYEAMQRTEWSAYVQSFGLTGREGELKFPVMEIAGNHDSPGGTGYVISQMAGRHRTRAGLKAISNNGLHYSWDWNGVHFTALGLIVGTEKSVSRKRRYAAMDSLDFLREDLAAHVAPDQPLVLLHHVDVLRYSSEKPDANYETWEWDPADVQAYHATIKDRKAAFFYGHTHVRSVYRWDGGSMPAPKGIPAFNVDNGAHPKSKAQAFFYVEVRAGGIFVREFLTKDGWASGSWTPQSWQMEL